MAEAVDRRDLGFELGADGAVFGWERERVDHRAHVETGAADEQRAVAAGLDCRDRGASLRLEPGHRPLVEGIRDVDHVVRHRGALRGGRLRSADVEAPVDLHRVDRHDLHITERVRGPERELRLPRRRRPDEGQVRDQGATDILVTQARR